MDLRASPPIRDPRNPLYPPATELPDTQVPPTDAIGNFIIGPTHPAAPETKERTGIAKGRIETFTMSSADSVIYKPGIARAENGFNASVAAAATAPDDSSNLLVTTSRPATWTRPVSVYVPAGYVRGTVAPFMIVGDGEYRGGGLLVPTLDALIAERKIPPIVVIFVGSGGQDAQGSQRGREFDTVSGTYAQWIESEVLPAVERNVPVRLTRDPDGRVAMGGSSAGVAAFTMAWFRPDLYRRVLAFSPTFVNQQWPHDPVLPGGAWQYHSPWMGPALPVLAAKGFAAPTAASVGAGAPLIPNSPRKPIRIWFEVGDQDLFYPVPMADGMHDWVLASENMAAALAAKGYQYQFVLARNAKHVDLPTMAQTLPSALIWVWSGYPARSK
ncbi:alpha/beta hydrolase [Sphingomonas solaris]|nr:alpha/beta hydrolase-fold protein [Sphingomonas solaris]